MTKKEFNDLVFKVWWRMVRLDKSFERRERRRRFDKWFPMR